MQSSKHTLVVLHCQSNHGCLTIYQKKCIPEGEPDGDAETPAEMRKQVGMEWKGWRPRHVFGISIYTVPRYDVIICLASKCSATNCFNFQLPGAPNNDHTIMLLIFGNGSCLGVREVHNAVARMLEGLRRRINVPQMACKAQRGGGHSAVQYLQTFRKFAEFYGMTGKGILL
jgi:hypothetical protein